MRTLKLTDQDIAVIKQLIIVAGKSPRTGDAGMMTAAHYVRLIDEQLAEQPNNVVPIKTEGAQ